MTAIQYLLKKNKVVFFHGRASFVKAVDGGYELQVTGTAEETLVGKQIVGRNWLQCSGFAWHAI